MTSFVQSPSEISQRESLSAPPAGSFSSYPAAWYLACSASRLQSGPFSLEALGRQLAIFRTASGRLVVMDGRCSHLGADLGRGCVVGESIECPFHGWQYGADGRCSHAPAMSDAPRFARQSIFPVVERHGFVFFFNGREPLTELPFFDGAQPDDYVPGRPFRFIANCTWYMLAAHGFDTQHFATVHARELTGPPLIDCPHPCARRNRYTAKVVGNSIFDRLLRKYAGPQVDICITTCAGSLILITGKFKNVRSQFMIATQPLDGGKTLCEVVPFVRRNANPLLAKTVDRLSLEIRRVFTRGYMIDEIARLGNPQYNPHSLVACDADMIKYFSWAAALE
jgi:nitrite reductase/ring-hydroxylating ferredoxin subunit